MTTAFEKYWAQSATQSVIDDYLAGRVVTVKAGNSYATDGMCHNAEPGTYGHECRKPATWIGRNRNGFASGFCDHCKQYGHEAKPVVEWRKR